MAQLQIAFVEKRNRDDIDTIFSSVFISQVEQK
jgi:hypothetical protein